MSTPPAIYKIEGVEYTFPEVREQLKTRFPKTEPKISETLLRKRLRMSTRWDVIGGCPIAAQQRVRNNYRSILYRKENPK